MPVLDNISLRAIHLNQPLEVPGRKFHSGRDIPANQKKKLEYLGELNYPWEGGRAKRIARQTSSALQGKSPKEEGTGYQTNSHVAII